MRFLRSRKSKAIAAAGAAAMVVAGAGSAFAYWTASGTGDGGATVGTTAALTVSVGTPTGLLTPGGFQSLTGTVTNPGTTPVTVTSVAVTGDDVGACAFAPNFTAGIAFGTSPTVIPAGGSATITGKIVMNNLTTNQDPCKNVALTLHYAVS
jgi:hypothetical protein